MSMERRLISFCPCEYVTDAGQWDIVLKSIKKYKGVKVWEKIKEIKEACLVDTESVCPGGQHKTIKQPKTGKPITVRWQSPPSKFSQPQPDDSKKVSKDKRGLFKTLFDFEKGEEKDVIKNKKKRDEYPQPQNWEELRRGYENY